MANQHKILPFMAPGEKVDPPDRRDLKTLARLIEKFAPTDGRFDLPVPGLHVVRRSAPSSELCHVMSLPGLCIVAQGAKQVFLSDISYEYNESHMVVYAAEVPVSVKFIKASQAEPYLCLVVHIDRKNLSDLILKAFPNGLPKTPQSDAIYLRDADPNILQSAIRMLELIIRQDQADLLVPLMIDEILIRLLRSPAGFSIAQIGLSDSSAYRIARALAWMKTHFKEPIKVEELAELATMSPSSFHAHFKSVTRMTPLQFQKKMRLHEARQLLITRELDVSGACHNVGYTSVSQFSREYSRLFGISPSKDIDNYPAG